ncbi:MAG: aldo/keto reductase [Phycisphaerales bacterium JB065]
MTDAAHKHTLGRTGLATSVAGLGCGGHSRLGLRKGMGHEHAVGVVRRAIELGVNHIDTAESYGTEEAVGEAIRSFDRDELVLSTKKSLWAFGDEPPVTARIFVEGVEASLKRLGVDCIDILHIHALATSQIDFAMAEIVPAMLRLREQGKIRFLAASEYFDQDRGHEAFAKILEKDDQPFDVMMIGFNLLNPSARDRLLKRTQDLGVGTQCMFAVRAALSQPAKLMELVADLIERGVIAPETIDDPAEPLAFVLDPGSSEPGRPAPRTLVEAGYRYCAHEPGIDVVLSGTSNPAHLESNVAAIAMPPLPDGTLSRLRTIFGAVDCVSGN